MGKFFYRGFFDDLLAGNVAGADIRAILVMTNTTADTEQTAQTLADITTVDEMDGLGYVELDCTITSNAYDATDFRWEIVTTAGEPLTSAGIMTAGSRDVQAILFKRYVDGLNGDVPWLYDDTPTIFPFDPQGGELELNPTGEALFIIRIAD